MTSEALLALPQTQRFRQNRQDFPQHLPLIERIQADLREDAAELQAQEGWDSATSAGAALWLEDRDSIWRALRRNRYNPEKTHSFLLSAMNRRISLGLHRHIPVIPPYADSSLFYILPLPRFTDRQGRPIAVLTLREVARDENGGLDNLKDWTWWALEVGRRILQDWWVRGEFQDPTENGVSGRGKRRGCGGEGLVLLIDAAGAGYRNLEVDLLPNLLSVGHNNFPGMIEAVFVVNASWSHRGMWNIIKRILPRSALSKINFLDAHNQVEGVFDLHNLPKAYGGTADHAFNPVDNPCLQRYRHPDPISGPSKPLSRDSTFACTADILYTARNTPKPSRAASRKSSITLAGGKSVCDGIHMNHSRQNERRSEFWRSKSAADLNPLGDQEYIDDHTAATITTDHGSSEPNVGNNGSSLLPSASHGSEHALSASSSIHHLSRIFRSHGSSSSGDTPLQRIKSLTNFHLYLSPSRLAHIDLLTDSDGEERSALPPRRLALHPSVNVSRRAYARRLASGRSRPGLRTPGLPGRLGEEQVRSYSGRLQEHHAKALDLYRDGSKHDLFLDTSIEGNSQPESDKDIAVELDSSSDPQAPAASGPADSLSQHTTGSVVTFTDQPIAAYSSDANPWYGYPTIRVADGSIRPRYARNRKRDLVKTLLFLFMLRMQSLRNWFERLLGLNRLGTWMGRHQQREQQVYTPAEGLLDTAKRRSNGGPDNLDMIRQGMREDWIWMVVGFLLMRGTWTSWVEARLGALGIGGLRNLLGMV